MIKAITGFENYYIDEYGNVYNQQKCLRPYITNKGYKCIDLYNNGIHKKFLIHRLVAQHFIPNPYNYPIVLHLDNNKLNCYFTNLKWGTYSENNSAAYLDGLSPIPLPDNRKLYKLYNENETIICCGVSEICNLTQKSDSAIRNYIYRKTAIPNGKYANYYISTMDAIYPYKCESKKIYVQRSSSDRRVES